GPLPRTHGMLGAMLLESRPHRTPDIRTDPRFRGWWPAAHPQMRSFLGVPIVARGRVIGALYLTDREGAEEFSVEDERVISLLAAHAALAIENARLHERSRELSIVEERNRLARELHDAVTQKLFGVVLAAESGSALLARDIQAAGAQLALVRELAAEAMEELRSVIELQDDIEVVGEAADGEEALAAVAALEPDVVLMDLVMPRLGGVSAIERLRALAPATRVIVLTSFLDEDKVLPAVRAGAAGYLLKDVQPAELVRAIRIVDDGESLLHPAVAARVLRELAGDGARVERHELLTARELEVLALLARGR